MARSSASPAPKGRILKGFRFNRHEFSGALGDIGVLLPLAAGLVLVSGLEAGTVLLTTGLVYLAAGFYFRLPIPVQPLKAMAAIAIAGGGKIGAGELAAGAIIIGAALLFLRFTGLATGLSRIFAPWTVKGVQLAVGLLLIKSGLTFILAGSSSLKGTAALPATGGGPAIAVAAAAGLMLVALRHNRKVPAALAVVAAGGALGIFLAGPYFLNHLTFGPSLPQLSLPDGSSFLAALFLLVLPQLPVTFGNSVVATTDVARTYFGDRAGRVTPKSLCTTIGVSNIALGLLGSMPICHGSGGVTAHYRFGARTGGAAVIMGAGLVTLALIFGNSAVNLLLLLPLPVLGSLMVYAGVEHARLLAALRHSRPALSVALIIGLVSLIWGNMALGLAIGLGASLITVTPALLRRAAGVFGAMVAALNRLS